MPKLTLRLSGLPLKEYALENERTTIGRRSDNDIQLDDPTVSGIHAVLILTPDPYMDNAFSAAIADFNSTNGLFVNDKRVQQAHLSPGDVIRVGGHELLFDEWDDNPFDRTAISLDDGD